MIDRPLKRHFDFVYGVLIVLMLSSLAGTIALAYYVAWHFIQKVW